MSSTAPAPNAAGDALLSKAELRRRRILAKRGARMALVTGDQTLASSDTVTPSFSSPAPVAVAAAAPIAPTPSSVTAPLADSRTSTPPSAAIESDTRVAPVHRAPSPARRGGANLALPASARVILVALSGLALPLVRTHVAARASALQLFLAAEAVAVAPELAAWASTRGSDSVAGGLLGALSAAVGVTRAASAVGRDAATFLFALFVALRVTAPLLLA